jgi:hypothetical protein
MTRAMRKLALFAPIVVLAIPQVLASAVAAPGQPAKAAAGKTPPACGVKVLPLVAGNSWTYNSVGARDIKCAPIVVRDDLSRLVPPAPKTIKITVKSVDSKDPKDPKADTVATLEEVSTYEVRDTKGGKPHTTDVTIQSTITCNKTKFEISEKSFFFQGEPGGYQELTFDKFERKKDPGWKLTATGGIGDQEWREEIVAHWTRAAAKGDAKLGSGTLEIERRFIPQNPQNIATKFGTYTAEHLGIEVTGRVKLDKPVAPEGKPCTVKEPDGKEKDGTPKFKDKLVEQCDLPANWLNELWLVENVGVLQTLNTYAHMYQLSEAKLN